MLNAEAVKLDKNLKKSTGSVDHYKLLCRQQRTQDFRKRGPGSSEKLRIMKTRIKIFLPKTKSVFLPKLRWRPKKRPSLKFIPVFGRSPFLCSNLLPKLQRGPMLQFCKLFYANYTILTTQRGAWPNAPPSRTSLYAGADSSSKKYSTYCNKKCASDPMVSIWCCPVTGK